MNYRSDDEVDFDAAFLKSEETRLNQEAAATIQDWMTDDVSLLPMLSLGQRRYLASVLKDLSDRGLLKHPVSRWDR